MKYLLALLFSVLMLGCSKDVPLTIDLLNGAYVVKYSHGTETLELRKDGTFTQRYSSTNAPDAVNTGRWTIDATSGKVNLIEALVFDTGRDQRQNPPTRTGWSLKVVQDAGRIYMPVDADRTLLFEKQ